MNDYSFEKGMLVILKNMVNGLGLMLLLFLEGGVLRQFLYFLLILNIGKGVYDLYKESRLKLQFIACLYMALAGVVTGFALGFVTVSMFCGLLMEFRTSLLRLIMISLPVLGAGVFLAYRFDLYQKNLK
jgi:hypothetical protein